MQYLLVYMNIFTFPSAQMKIDSFPWFSMSLFFGASLDRNHDQIKIISLFERREKKNRFKNVYVYRKDLQNTQ